MSIPVEPVPDGDTISRNLYFPEMYGPERELLWKKFCTFSNRACESGVWRKYAPADDDVHAIGLMHQEKKRATNPEWRYISFASATAGDIRAIMSNAGHGFTVVHDPIDDADFHTHVCYAPANGAEVSTLKPGPKRELKEMLFKAFNTVTEYAP